MEVCVAQNVLDTMIGAGDSKADPQAAELQYRMGMQAEAANDHLLAIEAYRKASRLDGNNAQYAFKLAFMLDLVGEEDEAISIYEQLCNRDQPHINSLLNLAVVYEDRGEIAKS